jgi:hypothetical protein
MEVRGNGIEAYHKFIEKKFGIDGWRHVLEELIPSEREIIGGKFTTETWIPFDAYIHFLDATSQALDGGKDDVILEMTRNNAVNDFGGIYGMFLRAAPPTAIITRAPKLFALYLRGNDAEVTTLKSTEMLLTFKGFKKEYRLFELTILSYCQYAFSLCCAKNAKVQLIKSIGDGNGSCQIRFKWDR